MIIAFLLVHVVLLGILYGVHLIFGGNFRIMLVAYLVGALMSMASRRSR